MQKKFPGEIKNFCTENLLKILTILKAAVYLKTVWRIRNDLIRIRIPLFMLIQIWVRILHFNSSLQFLFTTTFAKLVMFNVQIHWSFSITEIQHVLFSVFLTVYGNFEKKLPIFYRAQIRPPELKTIGISLISCTILEI